MLEVGTRGSYTVIYTALRGIFTLVKFHRKCCAVSEALSGYIHCMLQGHISSIAVSRFSTDMCDPQQLSLKSACCMGNILDRLQREPHFLLPSFFQRSPAVNLP